MTCSPRRVCMFAPKSPSPERRRIERPDHLFGCDTAPIQPHAYIHTHHLTSWRGRRRRGRLTAYASLRREARYLRAVGLVSCEVQVYFGLDR
jgi:hypothetical protein